MILMFVSRNIRSCATVTNARNYTSTMEHTKNFIFRQVSKCFYMFFNTYIKILTNQYKHMTNDIDSFIVIKQKAVS